MYNQDGEFGSPYRETYPAFTQSLLQRWLREVHGYIVLVDTDLIKGMRENRRYLFNVNIKRVTESEIMSITKLDRYDCGDDSGVDTYEQALEQGLLETLKLIKQ